MTTRPLAVFRADAGPAIGAGHVARCLTLARELTRWGWGVVFATHADAVAAVPGLQRAGYPLIAMPAGIDEAAAIEAAISTADLVVVDQYQRDAEFETACRQFAGQILVIDDLADRRHDCDVLLDTTADRGPDAYSALTPPGTGLLLGADYVLLNEAFRAARSESVARRQDGVSIERILVSLGATDPSNATATVLDALAQSGFAGQIDVVLGPAAPFIDAVRQQLSTLPNAMLHVNPPDMAALVAQADFAVGASGTSAWERIALGIPSLLLVIAPNQRPSAEAFARLGAAEVFEGDLATLATRISSLLAEPEGLAQLGRRAAAICDGQGVHRVFHRLARTVSLPAGGTARLRAAGPGDSDLLFAWRSDPETVRQSLTPRAPARDEHNRWMAARLERLAAPFAMVLVDDQPAGVVRLEHRESDWEISITVAPAHRGRGVGKAALQLIRQLCPGATIYATIRPENTASGRIFAAAGYEPTDQPALLVSSGRAA